MIRRNSSLALSLLAVIAAFMWSASTSLAADGDYDTSFNSTGFRLTDVSPTLADRGVGIFVQADGKIVVPALCNGFYCALRYNPDGTPDSTFDLDGVALSTVADTAEAGALQSDGKVIVAGKQGSSFIVFRFNADGSPDLSFGTSAVVNTVVGGNRGLVASVLPLSDGKILVVGYAEGLAGPDASDIVLVRYGSNGALDATFGSGGILVVNLKPSTPERAFDALLYPDGRVLITGSTTGPDSLIGTMAARFTPDGSLDPTFGTGGFVVTNVQPGNSDDGRTISLHPGGRIMVSGTRSVSEGVASNFVLRYLPNGTLDTSFDGDGIVLGSPVAPIPVDLLALSDGKTLLVRSDGFVQRFHFDGTSDTTFSGTGTGGGWSRVAIQPDSKIVLTGGRTISGMNTAVATGRLMNTVTAPSAAPVEVSGRVRDARGRPIRGAVLRLAGPHGTARTAVSNSFGHYRFPQLSAAETYFVTVNAKRRRFPTTTIMVSPVDDLRDVDFSAEP